MSTYILTSMFPNGMDGRVTEILKKTITKRDRFAFIASEFEYNHEKTDRYFQFFLDMLRNAGIGFGTAKVIDGRMSPKEAQNEVEKADVVWLSGGDTPTEFRYLNQYGLVGCLKNHPGVIIGMSAGSINLAKTAICTLSCGHKKQEIYEGIGCVDFSVEPHFVRKTRSEELIELSYRYEIYGLCDNGLILCRDQAKEFVGEVYRIKDGQCERIQ